MIEYPEVTGWGQGEPGLGWSILNIGQVRERALHRIKQEITEEDIWDISVPDVHPEENNLFPEDYQVDRLRHYLSTEGGPTVLRNKARVHTRAGEEEHILLAPLIEHRISSEILLLGPTRRVWMSLTGQNIAEEKEKRTSFFLDQTHEE